MPPEFLAGWRARLTAAVDRVVPLPAFLTRFLAAVTAFADTAEPRDL